MVSRGSSRPICDSIEHNVPFGIWAVTINPQQPVDQKKLKETVEKATS
jgi:hypothetical protein